MRFQEWEASKNTTTKTTSPTEAPVATTFPELEERLLQVEHWWLVAPLSLVALAFLTRLEEMEAFLKSLGLKGLDQAFAKAKVISKARNNLASAATF